MTKNIIKVYPLKTDDRGMLKCTKNKLNNKKKENNNESAKIIVPSDKFISFDLGKLVGESAKLEMKPVPRSSHFYIKSQGQNKGDYKD